jgi:glycosyltransferase involved in cell wall biosynthesis
MIPKVLVLTKFFWPDGGGAELATYLIVKNVLSRSFDVLVVSGTKRPKSDVLRTASYILWSALESAYLVYLKLHGNAWGLLLPSMGEEPFPYALVESMLIGTIPIDARVGGVPEIVRGSPAEGYLFMSGNVNELVDKVESLLSLSGRTS